MATYAPHRCDFCRFGIVWPITARQEVLQLSNALVLLNGVTIGKCSRCGHRYFPTAVLKRAEAVAKHPEQALRIVQVPVVPAA